MDMQGSRRLAATQQQAWAGLNDPQVLQACIPGCEKVEQTGDNQYAMTMAVRVGPVAARFNGKIALADVVPPESYTLNFEGQGGVAGFGKGNAKVALVPVAEGGCELNYSAHAQVGGKIAQVGQRLVDGVARSMAEDFFKRFDNEMQQRHPAPVVQDAVASHPVHDAAGHAPADPTGGAPTWVWVLVAVIVIGAFALALR